MTAGRPLKPLGAAEVGRLLDPLRDHALRPLVAIAAGIGIRLPELAGVRRRDVDLSHGIIAVPKRTAATRNVLRGVSTDRAPEPGES
jgi:integrase